MQQEAFLMEAQCHVKVIMELQLEAGLKQDIRLKSHLTSTFPGNCLFLRRELLKSEKLTERYNNQCTNHSM